MSDLIARSRLARWRISLIRTIVDGLFRLLTRREVYGLVNIPSSGACLIVLNQLSNFDTPLMFTLIGRTDVTGLVAANYRNQLLYRVLIEAAGGTWIRRGASDRSAIKTALTALGNGWIVGLSPEGRRSPNKMLIEGKPGAALLASRANVPIIPVGLTNTENLAEALKHLRRITITVRIGGPFRLPPAGPENQKQQLHTNTDFLMCQIAALLPPKYRGVYANHPQLKALLGETAELAA